MIRAKYWSATSVEPGERMGQAFGEDGAPASSRRGLISGRRIEERLCGAGSEPKQQSEGALAEERIAAALVGAGMCAWEWDPVLDRTLASESAVEVFGLCPGEALESGASMLRLVHPDDVEHHRELVRRAWEHGASWHSEFRILRPRDGRIAWLEERATLERDAATGRVRGVTGVVWDVTARKQDEVAFQRAHAQLEARVLGLSRQLARAQEEERRRVSRELHDGLTQELTALILGVKLLEHELPEGALGRERLREVGMTLARITREVHDLAVDLRPAALDELGLGPALAAHVDRWSRRTGVVAEFKPVRLDGERLPPDIETAVYRVVQEALNNTAKHAAARRVSVIVERRPRELLAAIEDDGCGFSVARDEPAGDGQRLGLLGMRERLGLVGGALVIESRVERGTTVRGRIPLR